jgi:Acyclic terpene utilisation family protein AtuA
MNLPWRALEYFEDPTKGYEMPFLHSFRLAVQLFVSKDLKLVVNAGAFNPKQLATEVQKILNDTSSVGKPKVVAWVEGDDVLLPCERAPEQVIHLHNGTTLKEWEKKPITASAYIGAWGIVKALQEGADIVITGRVTDASPVIALAAWWHNWQHDDFDKLAHALAAGHLVECGPYVVSAT